MINAEVQKSGSESSANVIRKFSRRVQGTGLIQNARSNRYHARATSKTVKKKKALKRIAKRQETLRLIKEGKLTEAPARGVRRERETTAKDQTPKGGLGEATPIAR